MKQKLIIFLTALTTTFGCMSFAPVYAEGEDILIDEPLYEEYTTTETTTTETNTTTENIISEDEFYAKS